jgi:hypothetical protein
VESRDPLRRKASHHPIPIPPSGLHHFSASDLGRRGSRLASVGRLASVRRRGRCASGRGRGLHRRTSGRRGSGPRPSCRPTLDPTTGRGTSDNPGTARVGPGRRQPPPNPRALNRRSLRPLMLRRVRRFSCREYYPIQCERILLRLLIAASSFLTPPAVVTPMASLWPAQWRFAPAVGRARIAPTTGPN